ncbi:hypothetical protein PC129_g15708 [Phytophthora cactorum]|uniref:Transmembrane protein 135 N-terminal domain-containing protein n=1 Tax=Phytophthora cactorum TaxID=29920 RepID=A0A329SMQ1_9STRA|nr:hypothetical protein Pcac1_g24716 [Phytophthora cactorum]KAG3213353.1 hypothetical protein PC129_g15708 [Phytophthora cactorum]RAW37226.1 hypothetical protein PC110_g6507 [Phytophthora cactorum]
MFDSTQHLQALLSASSPTPHAIRGVSAALAALTAIANLTNNRKAILSLLRLRLSPRFELATPSRNSFALALFIGIFRYLQRSASLQIKCKLGKMVPNPTRNVALPTGVVPAAAVAAGICTLWMAPTSRPAVLSLLSTNAALTLFKDFLAKYSDLNFLKPLELLVFMAAGGWIFSAGFFNPESYERSHMKQILKSVVLKQNVAIQLQEMYRTGLLNPNPCHIRHEGLSCGQYARSDFLLRVVGTSLRLYVPVHLTTWILAQRHQKIRPKPAATQVQGFLRKLTRSSAYSIGYVYLGWTLCCLLGKLGDRSLFSRKLQFFLSGAIPSLAIFAESPGRRRSIGLILISYALVSAGNVATRKVLLLQPGVSSVRGLLEAGCVAAAVSVILPGLLEDNHLIRRMLLGDVEARAFQDVLKQAKADSACDTKPVAVL